MGALRLAQIQLINEASAAFWIAVMPRVLMSIRIKCMPGKRDEIMDLLHSVVSRSRAYPDCVSSRLTQDVEDPEAVQLQELWASRQNLAKHVSSEIYRRVLAAIEMAAEMPLIEIHEIGQSFGIEEIRRIRGLQAANENEES